MVIEPPRGWNPLNLRELWQYREMVYRMVMRDIKARYKQSALGPFWVIVMPLLSAGIISIVFGGLAGLEAGKGSAGQTMPYPVFVYSGMLIWNTFNRSFSATSNSLRSQGALMRKVYFPRLIAPVTGIASGLLDLLLGFVVLAAMVIVTGTWPTWAILTLPLYILGAWMVALAWGLWIATLSIRFRDLGKATGFLTQSLMWLTPVAWSSQLLFEGDKVPAKWQTTAEVAFQLNPLYHVVEGFRWAALGYSEWRIGELTFISLGATFVIFVIGLYNYRRVDANVVDYM
jgi:lipopolysaccharide transport system permease protein